MEIISFEDFKKLDIKIGKITVAEKIEGSEKLLKLQVDFGDVQRQIVAGIAQFYEADSLIGKECPFAFNLAPKMLKGVESQGMILAVDDEGPVLMSPDKEIKPGSIVK